MPSDSDTYFYKECLQEAAEQQGLAIHAYVLSYIELNLVRAGMVEHPLDYPWSTSAIVQIDPGKTVVMCFANPVSVNSIFCRGGIDVPLFYQLWHNKFNPFYDYKKVCSRQQIFMDVLSSSGDKHDPKPSEEPIYSTRLELIHAGLAYIPRGHEKPAHPTWLIGRLFVSVDRTTMLTQGAPYQQFIAADRLARAGRRA